MLLTAVLEKCMERLSCGVVAEFKGLANHANWRDHRIVCLCNQSIKKAEIMSAQISDVPRSSLEECVVRAT